MPAMPPPANCPIRAPISTELPACARAGIQGRQKLSADTAADCARNRVSGGAQVEFLRSPASYVASYRSRNNLNQQVNENA
jgi:hypothetical protein